MKIRPQEADTLCAAPPATLRAILIHGADDGRVRELGRRAVTAVVDDVNDPFRVAELTADTIKTDPARLADEMGAQSLIGGRRVVWLREGRDSLTPSVTAALTAAGDALLVIEGGALEARSSLRKLCEGHDQCAVIACYRDEARDLDKLIREVVEAAGVTLEPAARQYLLAALGGDRAVSRGELEKLVLFAGPAGQLSFADVAGLVGDSDLVLLDDLIFAMADGAIDGLRRHLDRALAEGTGAVAILRAGQRHFQRLHLVAGLTAAGQPLDTAMRGLRPPVFFKKVEAFKRQARLWTGDHAMAALSRLSEAELACKTTGLPADTICAQACLGIALRAQGRAGGRAGGRSAGRATGRRR